MFNRKCLTILVIAYGIAMFGSTLPAIGQDNGKLPVAAVKPDWKRLRAAYDYEAAKKVKVEEESQSDADALMLHIAFTGPSGDSAVGVFARPKKEGVYPCILLLHGLTSDKETMIKYFGRPLLNSGVAILALDAPLHGERKVQGQNPASQSLFPKVVREGCLDYRTAVDYLQSRSDVDRKRIGLLGYSMGSMMGSILGAVDNRIGAFALCVGGDPILPMTAQLPEAFRDVAFDISPSLYIGHIAPRPILMLNGKQDTTMRREASDRLYAAAMQPKEQLWFDCGHILPMEAGKKAIEWLLEKARAGK